MTSTTILNTYYSELASNRKLLTY